MMLLAIKSLNCPSIAGPGFLNSAFHKRYVFFNFVTESLLPIGSKDATLIKKPLEKTNECDDKLLDSVWCPWRIFLCESSHMRGVGGGSVVQLTAFFFLPDTSQFKLMTHILQKYASRSCLKPYFFVSMYFPTQNKCPPSLCSCSDLVSPALSFLPPHSD